MSVKIYTGLLYGVFYTPEVREALMGPRELEGTDLETGLIHDFDRMLLGQAKIADAYSIEAYEVRDKQIPFVSLEAKPSFLGFWVALADSDQQRRYGAECITTVPLGALLEAQAWESTPKAAESYQKALITAHERWTVFAAFCTTRNVRLPKPQLLLASEYR